MDVRQLRYFVSVIELRSFSRAAEVLHVAQPALGLQIRKLEDELHTQLLVRHSRGVEPTPAGNLLRERALTILAEMEETKQALRDFSGPPRGRGEDRHDAGDPSADPDRADQAQRDGAAAICGSRSRKP